MVELGTYAAAALLVGFAGYQVANTRVRGGDSVRWYACGFAVCMALSFAVLSPTVWTFATPLVTSTVTLMVGDGLRLASLSFLALTALWLAPDHGDPRGARGPSRRIAVAVGVQAVSWSLLGLAHPLLEPDGLLLVRGDGRWLFTGYNLLFTGYALWCLALLTRAVLPHARTAAVGPVRVGLRLLIAAITVGMVWVAWSFDDVFDVLRSGAQGGSEDPVSNLLGALCCVLIVAGGTSALWGSRLATPLRWLRAYRRLRALQPLWSALHAELPHIALPSTRPGQHVRPWEAEFALYRRVIEIRDAGLVLRPYAPPGGPSRPGAAEEAGQLAAALDNHRTGRRPQPVPAARPAAGPAPGPAPAAGPSWSPSAMPASVDAETRWLMQVAAAFRDRAEGRAPDPVSHRPGRSPRPRTRPSRRTAAADAGPAAAGSGSAPPP